MKRNKPAILVATATLAAFLAAIACGSDDDKKGDDDDDSNNNNSGLNCNDSCTFMVQVSCTHGPPDTASCVTYCNEAATACSSQWSAFSSCAGNSPQYICDTTGYLTVQGCESQATSYKSCVEQPMMKEWI